VTTEVASRIRHAADSRLHLGHLVGALGN
jgi:hypothetical protein